MRNFLETRSWRLEVALLRKGENVSFALFGDTFEQSFPEYERFYRGLELVGSNLEKLRKRSFRAFLKSVQPHERFYRGFELVVRSWKKQENALFSSFLVFCSEDSHQGSLFSAFEQL